MTQEKFNEFIDFIFNKHIKEIMCTKSSEYARGGDKLYNFKRAAQMKNSTPLECLRGMKLKHDVSIDDMLNDERDDKQHPQELWQEKLHDEINYLLLMWAILFEKNGWELK